MSDLIDRQDAIVALRNVWNALWEIDIPSPSAPEYIEHHEQVQGIMKMVQDMIDTFSCTESQREPVQAVPDINVGDMVSRSYLLSEYDRQHEGPAGKARKIIEEAPSVEPETIYCKDCKKHNIAMGDHLDLGCNKYHWYEKSEVCPLIDMRGKAQGHEFDYQFCAFAEPKEEGEEDEAD